MKRSLTKKIIIIAVCAALVLPAAIYGFGLMNKSGLSGNEPGIPKEKQGNGEIRNDEAKLSEEELYELRRGLWDKPDINNSLKDTSFTLFKKLTLKSTKSGENTMISPVSLIVALGMLENGAKGESLAQLEKALGVKVGELNEWYSIWSKLRSAVGNDTLKLANSLWYREAGSGLRVENDYLKTLGDIYLAEVIAAKFDMNTVKDINNWVKKNTDGMIERIISELSEDSRLLLINATTFNGSWQDEYEDADVKENVKFKRENGKIDRVTMLSSVEDDFYENKYLTGTKRYYRDGYYILLMRPKKGYTVTDVLNKLTVKSFDRLIKNGRQAEVHLKLPCFKYDYKIDNCKSALEKMGVKDVFDFDKSDLSGMASMEDGSNIYVSRVIHKTHIELDREGTKAAAVTAMEMKCTSAAPIEKEVKKVTLNKPFIYAICEQETGVPVFMGTVNKIN